MDTYRLAICEDDAIVREGVSCFCKETLTQESIPHEIAEFSGAQELREALETKTFDLLILDIMLGEGNGMELAKEIRKWDENTSIIFITGYDGYAEMGYDVQAKHFLTKPIVWEKLRMALLRDCRRKDRRKYVILQKGKKYLKFLAEDILYVEADRQHGIWLYFTDKVENFPLSLAQIEEQSGEDVLVQCHRSYLVNMRHVQRLDPQHLVLDNGQKLPVSRTYLKKCREKLIACING